MKNVSEKEIDQVVNFNGISEVLTGNKKQIMSTRIGKKYNPAVQELRTFVRLWIARNKKEK